MRYESRVALIEEIKQMDLNLKMTPTRCYFLVKLLLGVIDLAVIFMYNKDSLNKHGGRVLLLLARETGRSIIIGADSIVGGGIEIKIVRVGRGRVQLGIVAHPSISIYRQELLDQKPDE